MATSERAVDRGKRRAASLRAAIGEEFRNARIERGLSQEAVGVAAGIDRGQISRIERGRVPRLSFELACRIAAVLGSELSVKAYPLGPPVRDRGQLALLDRLTARLPSVGAWTRELPLPNANDLRAWDAGLQLRDGLVAFDAETHLGDLQALGRRVALKLRDDPRVKALILVVADTRHNRHVLERYRDAMAPDFPMRKDAILPVLACALVPPGNGILML